MSTSVAKSSAGHGIGGDMGVFASRRAASYISNSDTRIIQSIVEQAEVLSVILQDSDASQIGKISFRPMNAKGRDVGSANTAWPIYSNIRAYPLVGETVAVFNFFGRFYYFYPLNNLNFINNNSLTNVSQADSNNNKKNLNDYKASLSSRIPNSTEDSKNKSQVGTDIIDQRTSVPILKPNEGDIIIEGRVGNCIRFGYTKKSNLPNIKMSLLSKVSSPYIAVTESLDDDNCLWITTDEPLTFAKSGIDIDSKNNAPDIYDGKQIILSSDRIIFNSRRNEIILMSNKGIYNTSRNNFSIDSGDAVLVNSKNNVEITSKNRQIVLSSSNETILNAPHIYLGEKGANEPLVLGNKIAKLLEDLITAILAATYPTAGGPSGTAINSADLNRIKQQIKDILSKQNYTK